VVVRVLREFRRDSLVRTERDQIVILDPAGLVPGITSMGLWQMGGAVARIGENETAFHGRGAGFTFNINGNTQTADGFDAERDWARAYWSALSPYHTGVYVNFLMDEGQERIDSHTGRQSMTSSRR
jgi:hypothetical protein